MGLGRGANNFVELFALKLLLCFSLEKNCRNIQIIGDSMVVINQMNKIQKCRNINLRPLFEEVGRLMENFESITCRHVYSERNSKVDNLSKKGLMLE